MKEIKVRCEGSHELSLDEMFILQDVENEFALKDLSKSNFNKLKNSLIQNGFLFPFFFWTDAQGKNWILDGTQRDKVLKWMKEKPLEFKLPEKFPCSKIHAKDIREAAKALLLVSSKYGEIQDEGLYNYISKFKLEDDWKKYSVGDEAVYNFGEFDLKNFDNIWFNDNKDFDTEPQIDKAKELQEKWQVKTGQVWQLGKHRIICGDCTDLKVVEKLMDGEKANLFITDPPYAVSYADKNKFLNEFDKGNRIQSEIQNDHLTLEKAQIIWKKACENVFLVTTKDSSYYWFFASGGGLARVNLSIINETGWFDNHILIWLKNNHVLGRTDYNYKHEPILYGWKKDGTHKFYGGFQTSILEFDKPVKSGLHPTMKPVALIERLINNSSQVNEIIIDMFLGSGTTLIACENLNRQCRGIEIAPEYVSVTLQRWQDHTGKIPTLIEN